MMAACGIVLPLAAGPSVGHAAAAPDPQHLAAPAIESTLVAEMNRVRVQNGRPPLRVAVPLRRAARGQSRYLLAANLLTHDGPDGQPFWVRLVAAGYPRNSWMAENLAEAPGCDAGAARRAVDMWMASPGHRVNLLGGRYRRVGAGVAADGGCDRVVFTADFGS